MSRTMQQIVEILQAPTPSENISFVARNGSIKKTKDGLGTAVALPHIDARFTQSRLDSACGPLGWQSGVKEVADILMIGIGIRNPDTSEWVWKWDTGQEKTEKDNSGFGGKKSLVSQGFKRAGFQWGVGRDAYDYPVRRLACKLNSKGHFYGWVKNPKKNGRDFETDTEPEVEATTETGDEHIKTAELTPSEARRMVFDFAVDTIGMVRKEANAWIIQRESECQDKTVACYRDMYGTLVEKKKAAEPPAKHEGIVHSEQGKKDESKLS